MKPSFFGPLIIIAILLGCQNPYTQFYRPNPNASPANVIKSEEDIKIYSYSGDTEHDNTAMLENGFVMLGYASFNGAGAGVSNGNIQNQAREVQASVVLVKSSHSGTISGAMPYTTYTPGQTVTTYTNGTANAYGTGGYATGTYQGTSTTYLPGTNSTTMVPYNINRYDYYASFWGKLIKMKLGIYYDNLSTEMRQRIEKNSGIYIRTVVRGTPAFTANLIPGDIIIKIDDDDVIDIQGFRDQLIRHASGLVSFSVIRGTEAKTIKAYMN